MLLIPAQLAKRPKPRQFQALAGHHWKFLIRTTSLEQVPRASASWPFCVSAARVQARD
jgi:hypothetical protein